MAPLMGWETRATHVTSVGTGLAQTRPFASTVPVQGFIGNSVTGEHR